jgi:hypothetical protein
MRQVMLTPSAGKRLIGRGMAAHPVVKDTLENGTLVIIAGTTNAYVAEEILTVTGEIGKFSRKGFFRGITLPPTYSTTEQGRLTDESGFPGDVVIRKGVWDKGKTIYDVADELKEGDLILKGANALEVVNKRAAILIGNPQGGTISLILNAVIGRRTGLILPVGLEKRVPGSLDEMANRINTPGSKGLRLWPVTGEVFTEIDAIRLLTGVEAELFAAGGICGAEGSIWLGISGTPEQEEKAEMLVKEIASEPVFSV